MERRSVLRFLLVSLLSLCAEGASIALGEYHSCIMLTGGTVKCWGYNLYGQLGNVTLGSGTDSPTPVDVSGITTAASIAAGGSHSCALLTDGTVKCWGRDDKGQLGNGDETTADSATPVTVTGITTATSLALGFSYSCALLTGGTVKCWGYNDYGNLGDGTRANSATPVDVSGITTATSIASGRNHVCALLTDGTIKCWGHNGDGPIGNGEVSREQTTPVNVTGIETATSIAAGGWHTCALLTDGTMMCWGWNIKGQLGYETVPEDDRRYPDIVSGITTATSIGLGGYHSCVLLTDGTVKCWGENIYGQLGNGTTTPQTSTTPVDVSGITTATSIALGHAHACALLTDGAVMCWGYNDKGQLGDGTSETQRSEPVFALQISVLPRPCTCCESELKRYGFSAGAECHVEL